MGYELTILISLNMYIGTEQLNKWMEAKFLNIEVGG